MKKSLFNCSSRIPPTPRLYVAGDQHRCFSPLIRFCKKNRTTYADTIVLVGDAGFNYYGDSRDTLLKQRLSRLPVTLFCIQGNKENRPQNLSSYVKRPYRGDSVFFEEAYPNLLFARDGGVYNFDGRRAIVIGGAHSVDKFHRLENALPYWFDEEPNEATKRQVEHVLHDLGWKIDYVFSHTVPRKYEPKEAFVSQKRRRSAFCLPFFSKPAVEYVPDIDKSVECWLGDLEEKLSYRRWFAGHYHIDKAIGRLTILYRRIERLTDSGTGRDVGQAAKNSIDDQTSAAQPTSISSDGSGCHR